MVTTPDDYKEVMEALRLLHLQGFTYVAYADDIPLKHAGDLIAFEDN